MNHHHHHHHHHSSIELTDKKQKKNIYLCLIINVIFVTIEAFVGYYSGSVSLLSDAGHNLSDILGLILALVGIILLSSNYPHAKKASNIIGFINALLLIIALIVIVIESINKIIEPSIINTSAVMITSALAIGINGVTAFILSEGNNKDVNIRAAYLHAASDALVSIGVLASAIIIRYTEWYKLDGIVSLIITLFIAIPAIKLLISAIKEMRKMQKNEVE